AEDNTAWDLLHETRERLRRASEERRVPADRLAKAWEELYIAEGSDWFWWFGDDHNSAQDAVFDQLFRQHLKNVYTLLGEHPPNVLNRPITRAEHRRIHTDPTGFLPVRVNGRRTYFEWISAGHYESSNQRGTMAIVTQGLIREMYFGFDADRLLLRIDTAERARDDLAEIEEVRVRFLEPSDTEVRISGLKRPEPRAALFSSGEEVRGADVEVALEEILEVSIAFEDLKAGADDSLQFCVEAVRDGQSFDRAPNEGAIELTVPSPDFELIMWQA
ncbi:MAG: alpha-amylase/alpha-mannosidase, partial [Planctomycetaceae bacterium]